MFCSLQQGCIEILYTFVMPEIETLNLKGNYVPSYTTLQPLKEKFIKLNKVFSSLEGIGNQLYDLSNNSVSYEGKYAKFLDNFVDLTELILNIYILLWFYKIFNTKF